MDDRAFLRLGAGALASLLLHVAAVAALGLAPADWRQAPPPRDADPPRIRPGIERSRSATINWLGFETPTPHQAPESQIDQPQLALDPGDRPEVAPSPSATASASSASAPNPQQKQAPADAAQPRLTDAPSAPAPSSDPPLVLADALPIDPAAFVGPPAPSPLRPQSDRVNAGEDARDDERARSQQHAEEPKSDDSGKPATDASKDAEASARVEPIDIVLGRPVAAQGVDITTVRPRWTLYTRMTASPRNPLIEVQFDSSGRVAHARMLESSGRADVDSPLMDAVYNWRATGQDIDALSSDEPGSSRLILRFRIGLR